MIVALVAVGAGLWWWLFRPLDVAAPAGASDPACAQLAAKLPATVQQQGRARTSSGSPAVAAWGDPAIIWRCGVTPPGPTTDECIEVNGVDWVRHPLKDGQSFTTFGREPAVQVLVPNAYAPEPLVLPPFSAVVAAIPQGEQRCR
ncbi:MAG: DUF3515 domain-containing protein [Angustibacter sp.]